MMEASGFSLGVLAGALIVVCVNLLPWSYVSKYHAAITVCEENLPRSQKCVIMAVPKHTTELKGE